MISKKSDCVWGTCSDGFRMNVLPQAIANGRNHIGTIAGKLNGHDRREHADRLAVGLAVDAARDVLEVAALHRRRDGARALDHLDRARDLGAGVRQRLAHLGGDRAGEPVGLREQLLAQREEHARALDRRRRAPAGEGRAGGGDGRIDVGSARQRHRRDRLAGRRVHDVAAADGRRGRRPTRPRCSSCRTRAVVGALGCSTVLCS